MRLIEKGIAQVFAHGKPVRDEMAFTAADGTTGLYEHTFHPAPGPDGSVEFVAGCKREITASRRAEQALRESEAEFRTLATGMPQIVWASAPDGEVFYLNPRWIEHTGRPLVDSLGWGWVEAVHPDDRREVRQTRRWRCGPRRISRWRRGWEPPMAATAGGCCAAFPSASTDGW
ncbi:PAS domain-containing protein [Ramlibacter terrae]|uniref:histidine kinase n=1 Tax=Ramlibacter terrae TaxID=2732511 RepID=A0ABX6P8M4_9BURK|nr:PAS domain-containing protein [Ramlibacter terrae]